MSLLSITFDVCFSFMNLILCCFFFAAIICCYIILYYFKVLCLCYCILLNQNQTYLNEVIQQSWLVNLPPP